MSILIGTNAANRLTGGTGGDLILGGLGNDTIDGAGGNDSMFGGRGSDRILAGSGDDSVAGGLGIDTVFGGGGADVIAGGVSYLGSTVADGSRDLLYGDGGSDYITTDRLDLALGGTGAGDIDTLAIRGFETTTQVYTLDFRQIGTTSASGVTYGYGTARAGQFERVDVTLSNALAGSSLKGTNGNDTIFVGIQFNPLVTGGATIFGNGGSDTLTGSANNDTISGGTGDDIISAGGFAGSGGADRITGGAGSDAFVFNTPDGTPWQADTITDFSAEDAIILVATDFLAGGPPEFAATLLVTGANPISSASAGLYQVLYDTDDGRLFVDINGGMAGGVVHIATLSGRPALTAADLHVEYNL
jgi:Ca2+-binding RTX toxin-like protein